MDNPKPRSKQCKLGYGDPSTDVSSVSYCTMISKFCCSECVEIAAHSTAAVLVEYSSAVKDLFGSLCLRITQAVAFPEAARLGRRGRLRHCHTR